MATLNDAVRRAMVLMTMADGRVVTSEIQMMSDVYSRLFGVSLTRAEIDAEMDSIERDRPTLDEFLDEAAAAFDEDARCTILRAAACVSIADHRLHPDEKILMIRVGTRLALGPERIAGLLSEVAEEGGPYS
jgi:uncharacterized tellurite resistance protein B-like protein